MFSVHGGIAQSFNKHTLRAGRVPGTVPGAGLSEVSLADAAMSPEPVLAGEMAAKHWVTFSSRKGPREPRSVAAKLLPEVGGRGGGGSPATTRLRF